MSEVAINYNALNDAIDTTTNILTYIDDYINQITRIIITPTGSISGFAPYDYIKSASQSASQKIASLGDRKNTFSGIKEDISNLITEAKSADNKVSEDISSIASSYIGERKWYEEVGDWLYNTFCVDLANSNPFTQLLADSAKLVVGVIGDAFEVVYDWFKYGDGQYFWNIATSIVESIVVVAGAVAAFCAIPFSGGATIPLVIGLLGFSATAVSGLITIGNSFATVVGNVKALSLCGNIFDEDDGQPGAARYYGNISTVSEYYNRNDMGDKETNDILKVVGEVIDDVKIIADTTSTVCNIASIGNVKDYRVTKQADNINKRYKAGTWSQGYSFSSENIKRNIYHDLGGKVSKKTMNMKKMLLPKLVSKDKLGKYTMAFAGNRIQVPAGIVKMFNIAKTADNCMNVIEGIDGISEFQFETEDKDLLEIVGEGIDLCGDFNNIGKTSGAGSVFNKVVYKPIKNIKNILN